MLPTRADTLADAGRLIAWSAQPKETPGTSIDYRSLVLRYLDDPEFAGDTDAVAAGLGLNLIVDAAVGVIAIADADSPLRRSTAELVARSISPQRKALLGVALLAIARVAYPYPGRLEDPTLVGRFSVTGVVEYLNRITAHLADLAGDPEEGQPDLAEVHRSWDLMVDARSEARRASSNTKTGLIHKVAELLTNAGLARKASDDDGGIYRTTPRLTVMVRSMVTDSEMYAALLSAVSDSTIECLGGREANSGLDEPDDDSNI